MLYEKLDVWKESRLLRSEIYKITKIFPNEERFELVPQMRRSAVSVCSNIAEGYGRNTKRSFINFLNIARGSLSELDSQLTLSRDESYIDSERFSEIKSKTIKIDKMINGLVKSLSK